jgi:hypothetical protein
MKTSSGKNVTVSLFRGIGFACPNLKSLDLSQAIAISGDSLVHLFFHDAYSILHQVTKLARLNRYFFVKVKSTNLVKQHNGH